MEKWSSADIEYFLRAVYRCKELFNVALNYLHEDFFLNPTELPYRVLWWVTRKSISEDPNFFDSDDIKVKENRLATKVRSFLEQQRSALVPQIAITLLGNQTEQGLIKWIFSDYTPSELDVEKCSDMLRKFIQERHIRTRLIKELSNIESIENYEHILQRYLDTNKTLNQTLTKSPIEGIELKYWTRPCTVNIPTGVPFIDYYLEGGMLPEEVYGILGGYASGKTVLAVQLVCSFAMMQNALKDKYEKTGLKYTPSIAYLIHYEGSTEEMLARIYSNLARIEWRRLLCGDFSKLSTCTKPNSFADYEYQLWGDSITKGIALGERERLAQAIELYGPYIRRINMTGDASSLGRGRGYVEEIVEYLNTWHDKSQHIGLIVIDYVRLAAMNYIQSGKAPAKLDLRQAVGNFAELIRKNVSVPYKTSIWLLHQLNTQANRRETIVPPRHVDAAEAGNFAENLHFCFVLGPRHSETGCSILRCSKARRAAQYPMTVIKLNPMFCEFIQAENYAFDELTSEIIPVRSRSSQHDKDTIQSYQPTDYEFDPFQDN